MLWLSVTSELMSGRVNILRLKILWVMTPCIVINPCRRLQRSIEIGLNRGILRNE